MSKYYLQLESSWFEIADFVSTENMSLTFYGPVGF